MLVTELIDVLREMPETACVFVRVDPVLGTAAEITLDTVRYADGRVIVALDDDEMEHCLCTLLAAMKEDDEDDDDLSGDHLPAIGSA